MATMPVELLALLEKPWLLAIVLMIGAACGIAAERIGEKMNRAERRSKWQSRQKGGVSLPFKPTRPEAPNNSGPPDAADQLRIVMNADFEPRPLLNRPERRLLEHLDRVLAEESPGWRAMGQVALGEILSSNDKDAYFAINSKRVDLLIVDADCSPLHAVEFQGTGHHQGTAAARDAVKKEALRRAGISYVEVCSGDTPAELRLKIRKLAAQATSLSPATGR